MQEQLDFEKLLRETESLEPKEAGNPIFRFEHAGDQFIAKFVARRQGIQTDYGVATVLDVDIKAPISAIGPHSVFESKGISEWMDGAELKSGDVFVLRLHSIRKSGYKKFFFQKIATTIAESDSKFIEDDDDLPNYRSLFGK